MSTPSPSRAFNSACAPLTFIGRRPRRSPLDRPGLDPMDLDAELASQMADLPLELPRRPVPAPGGQTALAHRPAEIRARGQVDDLLPEEAIEPGSLGGVVDLHHDLRGALPGHRRQPPSVAFELVPHRDPPRCAVSGYEKPLGDPRGFRRGIGPPGPGRA